MFRFGIPVNGMRISNLHHETALKHLTEVQKIEPTTWAKLQKRIDGANTIKQIKLNSFTCPDSLPNAFKTWKEYAFYLAENIIQKQEDREKWVKQINYDYEFSFISRGESIETDFWKVAINTILSSDWDFTKIQNFRLTQCVNAFRQFHRGIKQMEMVKHSKYLTKAQVDEIKKAVQIENNRRN
jgi:predicted phosphoadenosine phosphosulfate sulfurtransferase